MRKIWSLLLTLLGLGLLFLIFRSVEPFAETAANSPPTVAASTVAPLTIGYQVRSTASSQVHILTIPLQGRFSVMPAAAPLTEPLDNFAKQHPASQSSGAVIAAINGGFFDPQNQQSTSYIILRGKVVADPRQNDRLTTNPDLKPYLAQIFNRTELRQYRCQQAIRYEFAQRQDSVPAGCALETALGAGPQLLPTIAAQAEGFVDVTNGRDSLATRQPNARSAIGLSHDRQTMIWVMVAQTSPESGMSLSELAALMRSLGAETAMNLDGGSSSALYYQGKTIYGKVDEAGRVQRSLKSVLFVKAF